MSGWEASPLGMVTGYLDELQRQEPRSLWTSVALGSVVVPL